MGDRDIANFKHNWVGDDEGLLCLFCQRSKAEHGVPMAIKGPEQEEEEEDAGMVEADEDDWDAIQNELKSLTRMKTEEQLRKFKTEYEKLRDDVGPIQTWGWSDQ